MNCLNKHFLLSGFVVSLTRTLRKGLDWKRQSIEEVRKCVAKYPHIFVFHIQNMRNNLLKELRKAWKADSRFIFGKNRIMQIGLGRTKAEELAKGLHKLSKQLTGQVGLLFTERSKKDVLQWAENYWALEYARAGHVAQETIVLPEGPQPDFSHAIEPHLRSLGLPTKLHKGVVHMYTSYTACEKDKMLTPEQAKILKLFARPLAEFRVTIKCSWTKNDGFEMHCADEAAVAANEESNEEEEEDENEEQGNDSGQGDDEELEENNDEDDDYDDDEMENDES